ncbi:hypothetical protein [Paenibacillus sp. FSL H3-0333]|uniref:hypothetical protein n=1 Tax=Paenibacillus sp. FSL H3-0333 TaxID=2921373 RepID=UPI0030F87D20
MSFVSIVARENFINVMSDGRVTGSNDEVVDEEYQKYVSNDKSFIAFAGTLETCEMVVRDIKEIVFDNKDYVGAIYVLLGVFKQIKLEEKGMKVMMALGGVNKIGEIEFYTVDSIKKEAQTYIPKDDDIAYAFLNNTEHEDVTLKSEFIGILKETGFDTPSKSIQAQRLMNNNVADRDKSVNKKTFRAVIKKSN